MLGYGITDLQEAGFDDAQQLVNMKPQLRQALASCLEGRSLRTRVVAQSLRDFGRTNRQA